MKHCVPWRETVVIEKLQRLSTVALREPGPHIY
jgi:hypothetical protein